jgi:hypothetical protein
MAGVVTVCYMFLSARAITIWSAPREGPSWAMLFGYFSPVERSRTIPRRSAVTLATFALLFEGVIAYAALQPEFLPHGGSVVFAVQIGLACGWTVYFFRLPRRPQRQESSRTR